MKSFRDEVYLSWFDCHGEQLEHKFYNNPLPFDISSYDFMQFLKDINEHEGWNEYHMNASGNCEWACFYICKLAIENNFKDVRICYGNYGYGEHYWVSYKDWFIDLTLSQFVPDAPHLSITKRNEACGKTAYRNYTEYTLREYLKDKFRGKEISIDSLNELIEVKLASDNWLENRMSMEKELEERLNGSLEGFKI